MTKEYELHTVIEEVIKSIEDEMTHTKLADRDPIKFKNLCLLSFVQTILESKKNKYLTELDAYYLSNLRAAIGIEGLEELQTKELNFETI